MNEVLRVLRDKFHWDTDDLRDAEALIADFAELVHPTETVSVITGDPDDNRVLECAAEAGSEYIVTGDADLLRLATHGAARILKVAEFMQIVAGERA